MRQRNILLVEGDFMVRQALGQALSVENYRVVSVRNQQEAIKEFSNQPLDQPIDIVLLDLNPRNESAWETVQHLTALQPDLPVVAMSARLEQYDSSCPDLSVDAVVEKPLDIVSLMQTLSDLISSTSNLSSVGRSRRLVPNLN
jgi:DNA-binding response OmpR family regulator